MVDASSASHVPGHICCCPLQQSNDTLSDHCLQVVLLDTLDLMIPLLERHFSLPRGGITTKGVNSGGTHSHPRYKCAEEVDDICISPRGTCRLLGRPTWSLSPPPWKVTSPLSTSAELPAPGTLKLLQGDLWGGAAPPSLLPPQRESQAPPRVDQGEVPKYPRSGPIGAHHWGGAH